MQVARSRSPSGRLAVAVCLSCEPAQGDSPVANALVRQLAHPVISTSAATPDGEVLIDARDIKEQLGHGLDLILDGGYKANEPSTVIDLTGPEPVVVRRGKGDVSDLPRG